MKSRELLERCLDISCREEISHARAALKQMLDEAGISDEISQAQLLTILDELGKNILRHGRSGRICMSVIQTSYHTGFRIVAEDQGRGIMDLDLALTPGYSEDKGMGMGLNLVKILSDDIRIASKLSGGTIIEVWKWI